MDSQLSKTGAALGPPDHKNEKVTTDLVPRQEEPNPVISEERALDQTSEAKQEIHKSSTIEKIITTEFIQKDISNFSNIFSLFGNGFSALMSTLPVSKKSKKFANDVGTLATKMALGVNGAIGGLNQLFLKRNLISGLMHLAENLVIALFPQNKIYFIRGLNSGINLMTFGLNQYDKTDKFKSYGDYLSTLWPNLKEAFSEIGTKQIPKDKSIFLQVGSYISNVFKTMWSKDSGVLSVINGFGMATGTFIGLTTPYKLFGKVLRNTTGFIQDFVRLKDFDNKPNDFYSGMSYLVGSVLNYSLLFIKKKYESTIVPLVFAADGLARYFFRKSQDMGEMVKSRLKSIAENTTENNEQTNLVQTAENTVK